MALTGTIAPTWGVGRNQRVLIAPESALETIASLSPAGTKGLATISAQITEEQARLERTDRRGYPGIKERITGKKSAKWSLESHVLAAAVGVAPDVGQLIKSAMFAETIVGATSVSYAPSILAANFPSFSMLLDSENAAQLAQGCYTSGFTLGWDGSKPASFKADGIASIARRSGSSTLSGNEALGQTDLSVTEAEYFEAGMYVQVGADTNTGAGYKITVVDTTGNIITVTPALAVGASSGDVVAPLFPSLTPVGSPISGNLGSITIGGATFVTTAGSVAFTNSLTENANIFGADRYTRVVKYDHRVKVALDLYADNADLLMWQRSKLFAPLSTVITLGTAAPNRCEITLANLEFDVSQLKVSGDGGQMFSLSGTALWSSGNDDIVIKFF